MTGFDYLNELLGKKADTKALGRAVKEAGLMGVDLSSYSDGDAYRVATAYLREAQFPPVSCHAVGVSDVDPHEDYIEVPATLNGMQVVARVTFESPSGDRYDPEEMRRAMVLFLGKQP